jgi:hypothetical protein
VPTALYTLGLPFVYVVFVIVIEKWGGLVERRGDYETT